MHEMQKYLYERFCDSEHSGFLNDVSITFIGKTDSANPLQRENYWKHTLKTFALYYLKIKENVSGFIAGFDLVYMNWCYLHSYCCSYTCCLQLLAIRYMISKMKAIFVIRV